jgi:hypothetical protein
VCEKEKKTEQKGRKEEEKKERKRVRQVASVPDREITERRGKRNRSSEREGGDVPYQQEDLKTDKERAIEH